MVGGAQPAAAGSDYVPVGERATAVIQEPDDAVMAEPLPRPSETPDHSSLVDDDALREDHLVLECPYCGLMEQRIGSRCEKCSQVVVRLPTWAQHRRRNWLLERLSWRRIISSCAIVLFILFIVWINYPFAPNPVIFFQEYSDPDDG